MHTLWINIFTHWPTNNFSTEKKKDLCDEKWNKKSKKSEKRELDLPILKIEKQNNNSNNQKTKKEKKLPTVSHGIIQIRRRYQFSKLLHEID